MTETRDAYVRRVLPDLVEIEGALRRVLDNTDGNPRYYLGVALSLAGKLVEDLERAQEAAEWPSRAIGLNHSEGSGGPTQGGRESMVLLGHSSLKEGLMSNEALVILEFVGAISNLTAAIFYLASAVATLAVVGLMGYLVALRKARP